MDTNPLQQVEQLIEQKPKDFNKKTIILVSVISLVVIACILSLLIFLFFNHPRNTYNPHSYSYNQTNQSGGQTGMGMDNSKAWNDPSMNMIMEAQNLSSCNGNTYYTSQLVDPSTIDSIDPLGHSSSYNGNVGHVVPVDHMYVNLKRLSPVNSPSIVTSPANIYSPGNIEIFQVADISHSKNGVVTDHDYTLYFAPCKELTSYLGHVDTISPVVQNSISSAQKFCQPSIVMDGVTFTTCTYSTLLTLKPGDLIGSAGGSGHATVSFDFGTYDKRIIPHPFIDSKYYTPDNLYSVCGLDYYTPGAVKTSLYMKVNNTVKNAEGFPDCGTNMQDLPGTLQGNWYLPNTPTNMGVPNQQAIVFVHKNIDPKAVLIDWGGTIAPAETMEYYPLAGGTINIDPSVISANGKTYCFQDPTHYTNGVQTGRSVLVEMTDQNTIKVDYKDSMCSSHTAFTNPTTYIR